MNQVLIVHRLPETYTHLPRVVYLQAGIAEGSLAKCEQALTWGAANLASKEAGLRELLCKPTAAAMFRDAASRGHADILSLLAAWNPVRANDAERSGHEVPEGQRVPRRNMPRNSDG